MSEQRHLDEAAWSAFLAGRMSAEERATWTAHLETKCAICDEVLQKIAAKGGVELEGSAPRAPEPEPGRGRGRAWGIAGLAIAVTVALIAIVVPRLFEPERPAGSVIVLTLLDAHAAPLAPHANVLRGSKLMFSVYAGAPACIELFHGSKKLTEQAACLTAGKHTVPDRSGQPLAFTPAELGEHHLRAAVKDGGREVEQTIVVVDRY